jgi:DNA-binding MarR family transcriptional regulator
MTEEISKFSRVPPRAAGMRELRGEDLRVLIAIGQHADKTGSAYPSLEHIGALTGVLRKNVPRSIERLENAGLIQRKRVKAEGGGWDRSEYRVLFNPAETAVAEQTVEQTAAQRRAEDGSIANAMLAIWQSECGDTLPVPRKLDRSRTVTCRARFRDSFHQDLEQWRGLCREIRASAFCCGGGNRAWKADFDWALKPKSIRNLIEGKYRDNGSSSRRRVASSGPVGFEDYEILPLGPGGT